MHAYVQCFTLRHKYRARDDITKPYLIEMNNSLFTLFNVNITRFSLYICTIYCILHNFVCPFNTFYMYFFSVNVTQFALYTQTSYMTKARVCTHVESLVGDATE